MPVAYRIATSSTETVLMFSKFPLNTMSTIIDIPLDREFNIPPGNYRALLSNVTEPKLSRRYPAGTGVRLVFDVTIPSLGNVIPSAGRSFDASFARSSDLRAFIESWLGPDILKSNGRKAFDLKDLIGKKADVRLIHIESDKHANPFVHIHGAYPPGTLVLTEEPAAFEDGCDRIVNINDNAKDERKAA